MTLLVRDQNLIISYYAFVTFSGFVVHFVGNLGQFGLISVRDHVGFPINTNYTRILRARAQLFLKEEEKIQFNFS